MREISYVPRFAGTRLRESLEDSPVVLVHGPRQCGKTTLVRRVCEPEGHAYFSFDDPAVLAAAASDPTGFVADLPERVILDEIQRAPDLLRVIKLAVDRDRAPGRFVLTGSSNILLLPALSDSLAGRMETIRLHPLSQGEIAGQEPWLPDALFSGSIENRKAQRLGAKLAARIVDGGFPSALARSKPARRRAWYEDYVQALVLRDVRDLTRIRSLEVLPSLVSLVAAQTSRLVNVSSLAEPFRVSRTTIAEYVTLLERLFLLDLVAPWHSNRLSRLVKTPRIHVGDTGVGAALLGLDAESLYEDREAYGQMVETFVFQEVRRQFSGVETPVRFFHFRDKDGVEVDLVLERSGRELSGIEIKASSTVTEKDVRGLRKLRDASGKRFRTGLVVYDGETVIPFGDRLFAVPVSLLWQ